MKQSVRFVLTLIVCLVLSLSGVLVSVPAARAADTGTWTQLPFYKSLVHSLAIDPLTPTTLYAGTDLGVWRSTDSGTSWVAKNTDYNGTVLSLAINPVTPSTLYAGGYGVFRSTDSGTTWTAVNTGFANVWVTSLAINPATPDTLYAGTKGGVFRSTDSGTSWTAVNTGFNGTVLSLAINPLIPSTLYAGTEAGSVFRSTDSGDHWTVTGLTNRGGIRSLAINPVTASTLYTGTAGSGVSRSTDSGMTWAALNAGLTDQDVSFLAINPATPSTLYAGTQHGGVFCSTDSGITWTAVNTGLTAKGIASLAIDPLTPGILYAGTDGGVFRYGAASFYVLTTTASPSAGGSVRRSPNAASYAPGTVVTLTAIPAAGYVLIGWSGDLSGPPTNPPTITMDADKNVTASFAVKGKSVIQLKIGSTTMYVDGKPTTLETAPIILNSRTLLPIRAVVEAAGGTIAWDASTQKVTIVRKGKTVELWIGRNVAKLNGKSVNIDSNAKVVPIIRSGRTLLPLRFVAEALALDVQWDATTQTITITYTP
jgi:photosystem II stability/assembly factor-like uncharacterized protein